ncbi:regulator of chromosome condensation (RCC1) [Thraustotheca clavata]|uniref:Regulator of chromosome condensation (RCC1) n=1 Tax=Thraustotheca clavata TaxID=74557 RepID=A0A1V9ZPZ5_9STRA|nr:regulator of chromosome condensation (RCC1) [Thraustotheca clavata]
MDDFSREVRSRIRLDQKLNQSKVIGKDEYLKLSDQTVHAAGQPGCYCLECLKFRKEDWRVGDVNASVVGPRDQWQMYHWGNGERGALISNDIHDILEPRLALPIIENIIVEDSSGRKTSIEREAKFKAVASGMYHSLLLAESHQLFVCGDNSYHALGINTKNNQICTPISIMTSFPPLTKTKIIAIAATEYASFAIVDKPREAAEEVEAKEKEALLELTTPVRKKALLTSSDSKDTNEYNRVYSWGRGDKGVLGHGSNASVSIPRVVQALSSYRVTQIATGRQHVVVLTEHNGLFAFGDGRYGKLGRGTTDDALEPVHIDAFDRFYIAAIGAGNDYSCALTDNLAARQVFVWGRGEHGIHGNGDQLDRLKPTRVSALRGKKIRAIACGGNHILALSGNYDQQYVVDYVFHAAIPTAKNGTNVFAWGHGAYGQLGHRDTWDSLLPRAIDELKSEKITSISAGARHSLALTVDGDVWVWGHGLHGYQLQQEAKQDHAIVSLLYPRRIKLPGIHVIGAVAGRERTFVWGDRAGYHKSERIALDKSSITGFDRISLYRLQ